MNKFLYPFLIVLALAAFTACSGVPFVAQNEPTATATRRIRPTFTPKPRPTETEEILPTEEPTEEIEPTEEPQPTEEQPTAAPKPVTKAPKPPAPAQPTQPPAPTEVPKPQFSVNVTSQYLCEQQGVYKLILNAKKGRAFAGGLTFGVFSQGGQLLEDGAGKRMIGQTISDINVSIGSNCRVEADFVNPNSSNGELDVSDVVRMGNNPLIVRFVKSADDLTPISPDISVNFGNGGQYWMYVQAQ